MSNFRGSILITTLWIMAILSLLALGIGFRSSIELCLSRYNIDSMRAEYLAKAGVLKARESLKKDINEYESLYECGISLMEGQTPEGIFGAESNKLAKGAFSVFYSCNKENEEGGHIRYGMIDEGGKVNINMNKISLGNSAEFRRILKGLSLNLTDDVVDAIIDWQDTDNNETGFGGAEDFYYESLENPYNCKDKEFESIEELLLVRGVDRDLFEAVKDYVTVYGNGKININTAPAKVLEAAIDDASGTYKTLVEDIIEVRKGQDGIEGTRDDVIFRNIDDLLGIAGQNFEKNRISQLSSYFSVHSNSFRIVSHGEIRKVQKIITCVVNRTSGTEDMEIEYYHEE